MGVREKFSLLTKTRPDTGKTVANSWAGAVTQKPLVIQKRLRRDRRTNRPTDGQDLRIKSPRQRLKTSMHLNNFKYPNSYNNISNNSNFNKFLLQLMLVFFGDKQF